MEPRALRIFPLAYHCSLQAYGRWLPGDPRGWHRRGDGPAAPPRPGHPTLHARSKELQRYATTTITEVVHSSVVATVSALALARGWTLHEISTVPTHLHFVVTARAMAVDVLHDVRTETTAALVRDGLLAAERPFWSAGGHFEMIHSARSLERARGYVTRHRRGPFG